MSDRENPHQLNEGVIYFNAKSIGQSLMEVSVDVIKQEDHDIESSWYHAPQYADLFMWKDEKKQIIKQQITFFGQLVEWNILDGIRTGMIIEDEASQKMGASPIIQYDSLLQKHGLEQARDIISFIVEISEGDRSQLIANFSGASEFRNFKNKAGLMKILKSLGFFSK